MLPYLTGQAQESPRSHLAYFSDDGELMAVRVGDWKLQFGVQRALQMNVWAEPLVQLRVPHIFNLRRDPFERADYNSNTYWDWMVDHAFLLYQVQAVVAEEIRGFAKFPPRQKPASFNLDRVLEQVSKAKAS
jgi:arylsulfatase